MPATPQNADGMRTDPPASVPTAAAHSPPATAAAEPPLVAPAVREGSRGLRAYPKSGWNAA